jgi:hypothetical protein
MERIGIRGKVVIAIIMIAGVSRFFPVMNFSPLAAMGLFGGAYLSKRWLALTLPLLAVWFSDILLNNTIYAHMNEGFTFFYQGWEWQYGAYLAITLLGMLIFRRGVSGPKVLGSSLVASALFFMISNFGVWASGLLYPLTLEGLLACYAAGLPFLKGTLFGDMFYSGVLFGGFYLLQQRFSELRPDRLRAN